jgi:hypothetical protein
VRQAAARADRGERATACLRLALRTVRSLISINCCIFASICAVEFRSCSCGYAACWPWVGTRALVVGRVKAQCDWILKQLDDDNVRCSSCHRPPVARSRYKAGARAFTGRWSCRTITLQSRCIGRQWRRIVRGVERVPDKGLWRQRCGQQPRHIRRQKQGTPEGSRKRTETAAMVQWPLLLRCCPFADRTADCRPGIA